MGNSVFTKIIKDTGRNIFVKRKVKVIKPIKFEIYSVKIIVFRHQNKQLKTHKNFVS